MLYLGDNCEVEVDGCADEPCTEGQECTNLAPDEDEDNEVRYKCGTCPPGYHDGNTCVGTHYYLTVHCFQTLITYLTFLANSLKALHERKIFLYSYI